MKHITLLFIFNIAFLTMSSTAQTTTGSFTYGGLLRDYILHVPPGYNASQPTPLVLNLHGYTSNAQQQQFYTAFDTHADTAGYIVVYPNGVANAWNSGFSIPYHSGIDDVGFLSALIDTIAKDYNVDECRVFSTGMSNGGFMSYRLACELENKIAAVASVTGSMTDSMQYYCQNIRPVSVMEIHGTADPTVPYNGSAVFTSVDENLNFWKGRNNCPGTALTQDLPDIDPLDGATVTKIYFPVCDDSTELITYKINGGAHTWPGASLIIGVTTQDLNASAEIIKFFNRHPKCPVPLSVNEVTTEQVLVFPNPVENELFLQSNLKGKTALVISDITGKVIYRNDNYKDGLPVSVENFAQGIYYAQLHSEQKSISTKLIKK